jgi:hypothetical protein
MYRSAPRLDDTVMSDDEQPIVFREHAPLCLLGNTLYSSASLRAHEITQPHDKENMSEASHLHNRLTFASWSQHCIPDFLHLALSISSSVWSELWRLWMSDQLLCHPGNNDGTQSRTFLVMFWSLSCLFKVKIVRARHKKTNHNILNNNSEILTPLPSSDIYSIFFLFFLFIL